MSPTRTALVTGVTGYVGKLVAERLLEEGWNVRALTRSPDKLDLEHPLLTPVEGDASDSRDVQRAMAGVDVAWYLLHSMGEDDFMARERAMAETFAQAAFGAGVQRIVYLGGLHPDGELSDHLASRVEVGEILMASGVPTAVLQAGVLLGADSSSFVMLRYLSERLPVAIAPRWIRNRIQPIDADDAIYYLVKAADLPSEVNRTFDIGGPDVLSYAQMMKRYARAHDLARRFVATAPVTTPDLAAYWVGLVTPISVKLAQPLIGSLLHDNVVKERDIDQYIPPPPGGMTGFDDAVRRAAAGEPHSRWPHIMAAAGIVVALALVAGVVAATLRPQRPI